MDIFEKQYKQIIEYRGAATQKEKAKEELKELYQEIELDQEGDYNEDQMITEIADVLNMCFQLILIYGLDPLKIIKERIRKNKRELKRIEKERKEKK